MEKVILVNYFIKGAFESRKIHLIWTYRYSVLNCENPVFEI